MKFVNYEFKKYAKNLPECFLNIQMCYNFQLLFTKHPSHGKVN